MSNTRPPVRSLRPVAQHNRVRLECCLCARTPHFDGHRHRCGVTQGNQAHAHLICWNDNTFWAPVRRRVTSWHWSFSATYDWTMVDAKGHASDHITSMILFLRSTFQSFTNLPVSTSLILQQRNSAVNTSLDGLKNLVALFQEKVAQTACMSACKHIAACLTQQLVNNEVPSLSMGALQQVNLDLMQCESRFRNFRLQSSKTATFPFRPRFSVTKFFVCFSVFANSEPVPGFNDGTLQLAFTDLRQVRVFWRTAFAETWAMETSYTSKLQVSILTNYPGFQWCLWQILDLFIGWDWTTFFADFGKPGSKYLRVNPGNAVILLEKYVLCAVREQCCVVGNFVFTSIFVSFWLEWRPNIDRPDKIISFYSRAGWQMLTRRKTICSRPSSAMSETRRSWTTRFWGSCDSSWTVICKTQCDSEDTDQKHDEQSALILSDATSLISRVGSRSWKLVIVLFRVLLCHQRVCLPNSLVFVVAWAGRGRGSAQRASLLNQLRSTKKGRRTVLKTSFVSIKLKTLLPLLLVYLIAWVVRRTVDAWCGDVKCFRHLWSAFPLQLHQKNSVGPTAETRRSVSRCSPLRMILMVLQIIHEITSILLLLIVLQEKHVREFFLPNTFSLRGGRGGTFSDWGRRWLFICLFVCMRVILLWFFRLLKCATEARGCFLLTSTATEARFLWISERSSVFCAIFGNAWLKFMFPSVTVHHSAVALLSFCKPSVVYWHPTNGRPVQVC